MIIMGIMTSLLPVIRQPQLPTFAGDSWCLSGLHHAMWCSDLWEAGRPGVAADVIPRKPSWSQVQPFGAASLAGLYIIFLVGVWILGGWLVGYFDSNVNVRSKVLARWLCIQRCNCTMNWKGTELSRMDDDLSVHPGPSLSVCIHAYRWYRFVC